jgi:threonine/homoserine efflux transporter RhtA
MRNVLLAALVLVVAACGAYHFPGASPAATGTVEGTVLAFPCFPVESADQQCAGRPVAGIELDFTSPSGTAKAVTDSTGHFTATLAAGTWTVHLVSNLHLMSGPHQVTIVAGSTVTATYVVDSGIRVPVPQQ